MDFDTLFVSGLAACVLAVPAFFSAFADQRRPYFALLLSVNGAAAMGYAIWQNPGLYTSAHIMDAIFAVIGRIVA
ncbi:MAG: hypothetical protein IIX61_09345 [Loktanella sp.]|nr:hypothetical protein [Loktanella sp.]